MAKSTGLKTKETTASVTEYINLIENEEKKRDSKEILKMMKEITGDKPMMWGPHIIGFGKARVKSEHTGKESEWFKMGFAARKANLSIYFTCDIKKYAPQLKKLGKHKTGVGCLYINKLADVDTEVLKNLMVTSLKEKY